METIEWLLFVSMAEEMVADLIRRFSTATETMTPEEMKIKIAELQKKKQEFLDWMASTEKDE